MGFAGTPAFALPALEALAASPHQLSVVLTQPDRRAGRGLALAESPVKRRARTLGLTVLQPERFDAAAVESLRAVAPDVLVVVAYGLILPEAALGVPRLGCLNIHASLLPRWRGAAPIQRAILAGDTTSGVTLMRMERGLDTGPMLAQRAVTIGRSETAGALHDRLAQLGAEVLLEVLGALTEGRARATPQPATGITYAPKIEKREALIDWSEDSAAIERRIRAFNPSPVAETRLEGTQLKVWEAEPLAHASPGHAAPGTVLAAGASGIDVACGHGVLRLTRLQLAGRKPLTAGEFLRARALDRVRLGST